MSFSVVKKLYSSNLPDQTSCLINVDPGLYELRESPFLIFAISCSRCPLTASLSFHVVFPLSFLCTIMLQMSLNYQRGFSPSFLRTFMQQMPLWMAMALNRLIMLE